MTKLAVIMTVALVSGCSTMGWRSQTIDGSSQSAFEQSVARLQESLPSRRRAEFETSLAVIWLRDTTVGAGDLDSDGYVGVAEARALLEVADRVLTDIRRGVFISSIEERGDSAAGYVSQLGGLGYDDVIEFAALTSGDVFIDAARQQEARARCSGLRPAPHLVRNVYRQERFKSPITSRYCNRH